ncbi:MAG: tetratricopeptide repeat protein [Flavobacteriales bacterium]|jgi:serine phosphatase RsbU (regulator of sigma subunit)/tetratricopeptide (TPR) repeat protein|nr:tetratricopeptide repeat protein [Flavobacteriales bacterium]
MKLFALFFINVVSSLICFSQTNLDSLFGVWEDELKEDSIRLEALYSYAWEGFLFSNPDSVIKLSNVMERFSVTREVNDYEVCAYHIRAKAYHFLDYPDSSLKYYKKGLEKSEQNELTLLKASSYNGLATTNSYIGEHDKAIEYYYKALEIAVEIKDTNQIANVWSNIGQVHEMQGNLEAALKYYFKALKLNEKSKNSKENVGIVLENISRSYWEVGEFEKALEYNEKSIINCIESNDLYGLAIGYYGQGGIYEDQKKYKNALGSYLKSLDYAVRLEDEYKIASLYHSIVNVYLETSDEAYLLKFNDVLTPEELDLSENVIKFIQGYSLESILRESISYSEKIGENYDLIRAYFVMGKLKAKQKKYFNAQDFLLKAYHHCQKVDVLEHKMGLKLPITFELYQLYKRQKKYQASMAMYEEYIVLKDSLDDEETKKALYNQEYKYNYEKKAAIDSIKHEKAQRIKQVKIEKQKVELLNQKNRQLLLYGGLGIALLFSIYFVRKNKEVREQKVEVEKQKEFAEEQQQIAENQKAILGKQHREITDSINYAQSLQRSVLPSKEAVYHNFPQSFVLLKPKDVVSGDFYWTYKKGDLVYLAVVDCTGHGVPGAFMTIVANNLLNEIIQGAYNTPKEIVEELHQRIKLRVGGSPTAQVRDSMDLGLFSLNEKTQEVRFVGTHTSICQVRNAKLTQFKGSKADIGYKPNIAIEEQVFQVAINDMLYMHSDGYPDQKGGPKGKKFYYQPIRKKFEEISLLNIMEQEQIMSQTFEDWKGALEQFDDVCMIGVRI